MPTMSDYDMPAATTFGELDIHLRMMRGEIHKLVAAMPNMATKADIAELARKFDGYATHDDMRALRTDFELFRQQVQDDTVSGSVKKWGEWAQRLSAIIAFLSVAAAATAHLWGKLV